MVSKTLIADKSNWCGQGVLSGATVSAFCAAVLCAVSVPSSALAQSSGSFGTIPYVAPPAKPPVVIQFVPPPVAQVVPDLAVSKPSRANPSEPALPIVMFRGTPPIQPATSSPPQERRYSIGYQAERDALPFLQPQQVSAPAAPSEQSAPYAREPRAPFKRIYEDTKTGILKDIPEAIADALPWVDRNHKDEAFGTVLSRTADELSRAAAKDPEWALAAETEIRELSRKLGRLSEPPPPEDANQEQSRPMAPGANNERPFRPRPIWPGAQGRPEAQSRPQAIVTQSPEEDGPRASGQYGKWTPARDASDEAPATSPKSSPKRRAKR